MHSLVECLVGLLEVQRVELKKDHTHHSTDQNSYEIVVVVLLDDEFHHDQDSQKPWVLK